MAIEYFGQIPPWATGITSQSGGIPTGALIESGTNANGSYVRFANGTQICWLANIVDASVAATTSGNITWTFPVSFSGSTAIALASVTTSGAATDRELAARHLRVSIAGALAGSTPVAYYNAHTAALTVRIFVAAIGPWF
jgi:hypothetical protein